jgi:ring-1,2-phenylacetyl-CoA epoxidase subunit PaaC
MTDFILHLADTNLILAQRNSEWCGHGPILEQDIAITNISLDLLGMSRNFYQLAAAQIGNNATEDSLAYLRNERAFKNLLLVELPHDDWGYTVLRQYLFSQYQQLLFEAVIANESYFGAVVAPCLKSIKEIKYHIRWSREWVLRLGDGTAESKERIQNALNNWWCYTGEMFLPASYEQNSPINYEALQQNWLALVVETFEDAGLTLPQNVYMQNGGKTGQHTEHMGFILAEMQYLQRSYPGATW